MPVLIPTQTNPEALRTPVLDLSVGGQQGILQNPLQWTSSAPYVRQKIFAILVSAPGLIKFMPNYQQQIAALKSLVELMPQRIDGLASGLTWDYDGPLVGHAGEKFVAPIKGSRAVSAPVFEWSDKYGMAVTRFWTEYGRMLILDPDLGVPGIVAAPAYISAKSPPILPEQQTMTILFVEPDVTMTHVTNAWLVTNMMPLTGGDIIGKREMGMSGEVPTVTIEFTALTQIGKAVNILSQNYLNSLKLQDMRPLELKGYTQAISADIKAVAIGLAAEVSAAVLPANA